MSRQAERDLIDGDRARRDRVLRHVEQHAPSRDDSPLLRLAYWTALLDLAAGHVADAGVEAREAGHTWHVIGMAYGDRSTQAAHRKFGKLSVED